VNYIVAVTERSNQKLSYVAEVREQLEKTQHNKLRM